jgi:hypothetical protein
MTLQHAEVLLLALTLLATVTISALTLRQTTLHFRLQRTSEFVSRFNSKDLVAMREEVDRWVESGETPKALYLRSGVGSKAPAILSADAQQALSMVANLRTMTNFFQEFGTAIKVGSLDERYAHELLGGLCLRYARELRPFILESRMVRGRPQAYEEVFLLEARMKTYEDPATVAPTTGAKTP